MKRKKQKMIATFCTTLLLLMFFMIPPKTVEANDTFVSYSDKITYLKEIGTTDAAILSYTDKQVDDLYNTLHEKDVQFSGYTSKIVEVSERSNGERSSNIPTSQLELSIGTYDIHSNGKVIGVDVSIGYKWIKEPITHLTDALTFRWDDKVFYDDGFYAMACCNASGLPVVLENISAPAKATAGSIGWYTTLANPRFELADNHYGGAQVLLRPRTPLNTSAVLHSKMYLEYAHQKIGASISFGLGFSGPSASVSFSGGNYDKQSLSYTYR